MGPETSREIRATKQVLPAESDDEDQRIKTVESVINADYVFNQRAVLKYSRDSKNYFLTAARPEPRGGNPHTMFKLSPTLGCL